jgi:hypothetical protein
LKTHLESCYNSLFTPKNQIPTKLADLKQKKNHKQSQNNTTFPGTKANTLQLVTENHFPVLAAINRRPDV